MEDYPKSIVVQLDRTIKLAGARWAVWVQMDGSNWVVLLDAGLSKLRCREIKSHLWLPGNKAWIAGGLSSGRVRSRQVNNTATSLGCDRIFLFPNSEAQTAIIVGGEHLSRESREFFKILVLMDPSQKFNSAGAEFDENLIWPKDFSLGAANDLEKVFQWIIQVMSKSLPIAAGYLAIRMGDIFRIEAQWNYDPAVLGSRIPILSARELRLLQATMQGIISSGPAHFPGFVRAGELPFLAGSFITLPVLVGQRLIGVMVLASASPQGLNEKDRHRAAWILERLSHAIESAIVFADLACYLQQYVLLSELVSAATVETEPAQIALRLVHRLSRAFRMEQVVILLMEPGSKVLKKFGDNLDPTPLGIPIPESILGYVVESGVPYRTGDIKKAPRFYTRERNIQSLLAAPLKYRGGIIGVIAIESLKNDAFTTQDEQSLVMIASQLAGIIEQVRLKQEAADRPPGL